jgi:hypothetical protein
MSIEHGTIVIFVVMVSGRALIFRKGKLVVRADQYKFSSVNILFRVPQRRINRIRFKPRAVRLVRPSGTDDGGQH